MAGALRLVSAVRIIMRDPEDSVISFVD